MGGPPARSGFAIETHGAMIALSLACLLLMSLIFAPFRLWPPSGLWPVSFVCLVPWLIMIGGATHAPRVYFYSYVLALAFFLLNMRWMYPATGLGYVALSIYMAAYFPLVACPVRHVVRRRRWRLAVVLPLVWTGSEMLRACLGSGFPWFFLSHSLYKVLTLIQVSDLVGAYGVSFVVAAVNAAIADVIIAYLHSRGASGSPSAARAAGPSILFAAVLVAATAVYGQVQLHRNTTTDGPKIAAIQGDFLSLVDEERAAGHDRAGPWEKMETYLSMIAAAAREKPDLYLLPESPWPMFLNREARGINALSHESFAALQRDATRHNAYVVTGSASRESDPYDLLTKERYYNSATVLYPDGREPERYDKIHLVYFGEVVPFRGTRFHSLYVWLNSLMPFSGLAGEVEYSLFRGKEFRRFTMEPASQPGQTYRFGIPICYEDVMPYVSREFACGGADRKQVDLLLNISNDGWFGRGIQQPQHLAICVFRAVENRVGIARSVNTGVSAFIQPSGRIHDRVTRDPAGRWPGNSGYRVATVGVDSRYTIYSRFGDWFAWACAAMWLAFYVDYWIVRARTHGGSFEKGAGK